MKLLIIITSISSICYSMSNFISERDFTNSKWTRTQVYNFVKSKTVCLTSNEIMYAISCAELNTLNPLVLFATMQKESSLVEGDTTKLSNKYLAMGYHHTDSRTWGYSNQVRYGAYCLSEHFNDPIIKIKLLQNPVVYITPNNRAENALYQYTPRWYAKYNNYSEGGNLFFKVIFETYCKELKNAKKY